MRKLFTSACSLIAFCALGAQAQDMPKPGPEHDKMKAIEGTWDAVVSFQGKESKGTMTYKMGMGGFWMVEHFKGTFADSKFEGRGMTTYDPEKKKYVNIWADSMGPSYMITEGTFEKDNRMVMKGKMPMGPGKTAPVTIINEMKDKDNMTTTFLVTGADGKEGEMMKITYKRAEPKKKKEKQ